MLPPQKASRGLRGSTNCRESTYAWMLGRVCLRWVPLAFPHLNDVVPLSAKTCHFCLGLLVNRMHGTVAKAEMLFVTYGMTVGTAMPKTTVKFVHASGLGMKTIDGGGSAGHVVLAGIAHVLKVMALGGMRMIWVGACHQVVSFQVFVGELIQGLLAQLVIAPG